MRWKWLTFWGVAGLAMLISSFWVNWFDINFTWFSLNLGWFAMTYSGLLAVRNVQLQKYMVLTQRELHDWGEILSGVTPQIIAGIEEGLTTSQVAEKLVKSHQIPKLVSLKYMVALGKQMKKELVEGGRKEAGEQKNDGGSQQDHQ